MKLKHLAFLLVATIGICNCAFAQNVFEFKANFIRKELAVAKTIVILTNDVDPNMDKANIQLDEAVRKFWKATKVEFVNKKISAVLKENTNDIYIGIVTVNTDDLFHGKPVYGKDDGRLSILYRNSKGGLSSDVSTSSVALYHGFDQLDIVTIVRLFNSYVDEVIRGVDDHKMRVLTNGIPPLFYKLTANHKGAIKSKTLLVDKDILAKKTTEQDLKEAYSGKLKVVSREEILGYIQNNSKEYAYVFSIIVEDGSSMSGSLILDTQNGYVLSYAKNSSVMINTSRFDPIKVDKKTVKAYEENSK